MRKHTDKILRLVCIALGALLIFQLVRTVGRSNPLAKVTIPEVPTLSKETNSVAAAAKTNSAPGKSVTNATVAGKKGSTNVVTTNAVATRSGATNSEPASNAEVKTAASNVVSQAVVSTNTPENAVSVMIAVSTTRMPTNANVTLNDPSALVSSTNNVARSNAVVVAGVSTNATNIVATTTNRVSPSVRRPEVTSRAMPGMAGARPLPELAPENKARVDRIYESELFGQVMRPMPAALMGIAGNMAMLRSSSGQSGLVKEGDSLGEMKLLKIGVNRVLIEEKGEKKELMIFNGYGGESLLSKKESTDETTKK
jgi:hypothetical protein